MAIGGNSRYPTLQMVAELFRFQINDSFAGATDTPGEGLIMTDLNPELLILMNAAIRDMYADLRNVGDPALILDNYILYGIPPLAAINQAVQVSLDVIGFFNGFSWSNQWTLPSGCQRVERIWERWTGSQGDFLPMTPCPFGIPPTSQVQRMNYWETRNNAIWMPGCLTQIDLRLRCLITFPDFLNPATIDFSTTYIPILNCQNNVVDKMMVRYSRRFAPEQYQTAVAAEADSLFRLRQEVVRNLQNTEYQRTEFGSEATASYGWLASL